MPSMDEHERLIWSAVYGPELARRLDAASEMWGDEAWEEDQAESAAGMAAHVVASYRKHTKGRQESP